MERKNAAAAIRAKGYNCCQAVIGAFCEELGLDQGAAFRLSAGFGGGMRRGDTCGAVTGALMVLGLGHGSFMGDDAEAKAHMAALARAFHERFLERNGGLDCKELLGYNSSVEEERVLIVEKGLFDTVCPKAIDDAVEILEDLLAEGA